MDAESLRQLRKDVDTLRRIVSDGNGEPSLVSRMSTMERSTRSIEEHLAKQDTKIDRIAWIVAIGLGIVLAAQFFIPLLRDMTKQSLIPWLQSGIVLAHNTNAQSQQETSWEAHHQSHP